MAVGAVLPASRSSMALRLISPHLRTRPSHVIEGKIFSQSERQCLLAKAYTASSSCPRIWAWSAYAATPFIPNSRICCRERISGLRSDPISVPPFPPVRQSRQACLRFQCRRRLLKIRFAARRPHFFLQGFPEFHALTDQCDKPLGIEIHIGEGGKKRLER